MKILKTVIVEIKSLGDLRKHHKISQGDLGKMLGMLRVTVSQIELGERKLKFTEALKMCDIFQITPKQLASLEPIKSQIS